MNRLNVATCWQTVRPPTSVTGAWSEHARSVHAVEWLQLEDSILVSERVVQEDRFTTIHIQELAVSRDIKLGPEEITADIPNVGEAALPNWMNPVSFTLVREVTGGVTFWLVR